VEKFLLGYYVFLISFNENAVRLFVKNMTSPGLKMKAKIVLEDLGLHPLIGETGEIEIKETLSIQHYNTLQETLRKSDFELVTGKELRTFTGHPKSVVSVAFSPDGRTALSGSYDDTFKLWDLTGL